MKVKSGVLTAELCIMTSYPVMAETFTDVQSHVTIDNKTTTASLKKFPHPIRRHTIEYILNMQYVSVSSAANSVLRYIYYVGSIAHLAQPSVYPIQAHNLTRKPS